LDFYRVAGIWRRKSHNAAKRKSLVKLDGGAAG